MAGPPQLGPIVPKPVIAPLVLGEVLQRWERVDGNPQPLGIPQSHHHLGRAKEHESGKLQVVRHGVHRVEETTMTATRDRMRRG